MAKNLAVLDFDHTVVEGNTDTVVADLLDKSVTGTVEDLYQRDGWTAYMQAIFRLLHLHNVNETTIKKTIESIPSVEGFPNLIRELTTKMDYDVVIISDSNSYFIDCWLEANGLKPYILRVFTNPAEFDQDGVLNIRMYHLQDYCTLSTKNLCKGQVMDDFIESQASNGVVYKRIMYAGDGRNDFCPILRLREGDVACVRENYKCAELVKLTQEENYFSETGVSYEIKANIVVWKNGDDILNALTALN